MKSKRAKELIENGKFSYDDIQAYVLPESYVETIIIAAEQDAEERIFQAVEVALKKPIFSLTLSLNSRKEVIRRTKELLNNGGQSDE